MGPPAAEIPVGVTSNGVGRVQEEEGRLSRGHLHLHAEEPEVL